MKTLIQILFFLLLAQSVAADTTIINNALFSLEVPDQWEMQLQQNNKNIIHATSKLTKDGWPTRMLMVDYCMQNNKNTASQLNCNEPCSEEKLLHSIRRLKEFGQDISIKKHISKSGYIIYRAEMNSSNHTEVTSLKCSEDGQIFIWFFSSITEENEFAEIKEKLK